MTQQPRPVVLAVAHDPVEAALAFAVEEAARDGSPLLLVHVVPELPVGTDPGWAGWSVEADLVEAGHQRLTAVKEQAVALAAGRSDVATELVRGRLVTELVREATDAALIVLEHRDLSTVTRLITRSVASGVAARARVPVVTVPTGWTPQESPGDVVVGVKDPDTCGPVLRRACHEALRRGTGLTAVHTWHLDQMYGYVVPDHDQDEQFRRQAVDGVRAAVLEVGEEVADLPLTVVAEHTWPADALVEAAKDAALLVLGRHNPLLPLGSHLGPVVRAVLRAAPCPVLLLDPVDKAPTA